jgi:hypothetical protein
MIQESLPSMNTLQSIHAVGERRPRILLTDTNRWPVVPRLAAAFAKSGCDVAVVCPTPGHPAQKTIGVCEVFHYNGSHPVPSLRFAIDTFDPDLVVPACDRSVKYLHELHAESRAAESADDKVTSLIEYSLGEPESFSTCSSRYLLLEMARSEGIPVPRTRSIGDVDDLRRWHSEFALPCVLKTDGSWGGRGVRVARDEAGAKRGLAELTQRAGLAELFKRVAFNRDRDWVLSEWKQPPPAVIAQSYIEGRPANCAVVCWKGQVLAGIAVEVITASGARGPSIVVEVVEGSAMMIAAEKIARRLGVSGFFGLDFMIENATGVIYLVEMNPRCTPLCPLPLGKGRDLVAALWAQLTCNPLPSTPAVTNKNRIAYFPQACSNTEDLLLKTSYLDVPEGQPELVKELLHPWSTRSWVGQLVDFLRQPKEPAPEPFPFGTDLFHPPADLIESEDLACEQQPPLDCMAKSAVMIENKALGSYGTPEGVHQE